MIMKNPGGSRKLYSRSFDEKTLGEIHYSREKCGGSRKRYLKHVLQKDLNGLLSHPVRVRGLKLVDSPRSIIVRVSHPVRVRGLKQSR